jgi:tetratricopeptide (TPR) repeat protein
LGDLQTAQSCAEQALNLARKLADRSSEAWALTYLGHSLYGSEDNVRAMQVYREAADIRIALGQEALATEPYAGLARVALMAGDLAQAQEYVAKLLAHLDSGGSFEGTDHPTRVYLICYQVLEACGSPRANDILNTAHTLLQKRAAGLLDEADRQAFLWEVSDHRAIVEAWEQRQAATA